jgi:hypothetical protein
VGKFGEMSREPVEPNDIARLTPSQSFAQASSACPGNEQICMRNCAAKMKREELAIKKSKFREVKHVAGVCRNANKTLESSGDVEKVNLKTHIHHPRLASKAFMIFNAKPQQKNLISDFRSATFLFAFLGGG